MHPNLDDLLALRDGNGPPEAARHVERCVRCAEEIEDLRAAASALRALPSVGNDRDRWPEIRARVVARRRRVRAVRIAAAAASLIAAATTAVLVRVPAPAAGRGTSIADARVAIDELAAASQGLEAVLRDPALRQQVLSPRRAAVIVDLEDRIAVLDTALADPAADRGVERSVALWSHRVELLDALVAARTGTLGEEGPVFAVVQYEGRQP